MFGRAFYCPPYVRVHVSSGGYWTNRVTHSMNTVSTPGAQAITNFCLYDRRGSHAHPSFGSICSS